MHNVTLISTHHSELGECNSDELYKIIVSMSPDVIFEELTQDLFDRFYKEKQIAEESLEVGSIKKYLQKHNIRQIPVDIDASENLTNAELKYMFEAIKKYNVYKELEDEQYRMIIQDGFTYLNSKNCEELFEKRKVEENTILEFEMDKNRLLGIHKSFYEEQYIRENEMIKNIYKYSKENHYHQAVFLIGSAHRKSIVEKIEKYNNEQNIKLNWIIYGR